MRLGWHVNGPGPRDAFAQGRPDLFMEYVAAVRPPIVKMLAEGYSPQLAAWCQSLGTKVVARKVTADLQNHGYRPIADEIFRWGEDSPGFDWIQFANEEMQGKDHPEDFNKLCGYALKFMEGCERRGWKAALLGCSVGQPEIVNWEQPNAKVMLREAARRGDLIAMNEYYAAEPSQWAVDWDRPDRTSGALLMRCRRHVDKWHSMGIHGVGFFIAESGRDSIPGVPGGVGGWRTVPGEPYAERQYSYGLRLGYVPGCKGWVGFGDFAPNRDYDHTEKDWRNYALDYDVIETRRMMAVQIRLPQGGVSVPDNTAIFEEAERLHRGTGTGLRVNITSGFGRWCHENGYWPTINEAPFASLGGRTGQRVQSPVTGAVRVLEWNGGVIVHRPNP